MPAQSYSSSRRLPATLSALTLAALILTSVGVPIGATADEPMTAFAQALRDRQYFDVALEYLDGVERSALSADSLSRLPLEKATTYSQAATRSRDLREAETMLTAALKAIDTYQPKDATDLDASNTAEFRGDLHFNQAQIAKARFAREKLSDSQRKKLAEERASYLSASQKAYQSAIKSMVAALKNFQLDSEDSSSETQLRRLRAQYAHLKTRDPILTEEMAANAKGRKRKKLLKRAATQAKETWSKYRDYSTAVSSRRTAALTAARCYQKLGQFEDSQQMVNDLLSLQQSQVPATTRREMLSIAAKNWQSVKPFPWETVLAETENAVTRLTPAEVTHPQWQDVQLALAQALHEKSKSLAGQKGATAKTESQEASAAAIKLAQTVAQAAGDAREQAVSLLQNWGAGGSVPAPVSTVAADVKAESFANAVQLGRATLPEIESLLRKINVAKQSLRQAETTPKKQQRQKEVDKLNAQQFANTKAAINLFNQALRLADDSVTPAEINNVRYLQSYCYFARGQHIESAVIAKFMLDKYPNVAGTQKAASILLSNQAATLDQTTGDKTYEKQQLVQSCKSVLNRYPDTSEASAAAARLAWLSLGDNDVEQAKTWFNKIPSGEPQRVGLALSMGRRNWFAWSKSNAGQSDNGKQQLSVAKEQLTEGVTNSNPKTLNYAAAEGALLLAQALLAEGDVDAAIKRLESDEIAPLKLIKPVHPVLKSTGRTNLYHQQTVITAIKTYMAAMARSTSGQEKWIDKSGKVITGLQQRFKDSKDPADMKRLAGIYRLISQRLIEQFDLLPAGQPRADFALRLASFLTEIEKQSQDARTVVWAGSTLLSVANTLRQDGANDQSETIYANAVSALDRAQELGFGDGDDAVAMTRELKRQRALAQRGAGNFDAALEQFTQLLTDQAGDLNIQVDAAMTLQQKAAAQENASAFATAILGSSPVADPKTKRKRNAIWGWKKLVQVTRGKAQFQNAFYQSLYHMIEARFQMGRVNKSADGIGKALKQLDDWQKRDPDFDNGIWKQKFAQLRQRIQKQ